MRTYAAVPPLSGADFEAFATVRYPNLLVSFHYYQDDDVEVMFSKLGYTPERVLGDSGAFTVWTQGATVDLYAYTQWCLDRQDSIKGFMAISLDVIPGTVDGDAPTKRQQKAAQKKSIENGDYLRGAGVRLMEVFHWHEPLEFLDLILDRRQPNEVIAIGGLAGYGSLTEKQAFCDSVFRRIRERCGGWKNIPPVHGLGIGGGSRLATRYPWVSIDSSSWAGAVKYGRDVSRSGRSGKLDNRVSQREVRRFMVQRVLTTWVSNDVAMTKTWEDRGVTFDLVSS